MESEGKEALAFLIQLSSLILLLYKTFFLEGHLF